MAIDRFTKDQFEAALPVHKTTGAPLWRPAGLEYSEYVYTIQTTTPGVLIRVRSSVQSNGVAADTGEDSIRLWLTNDKGEALGGKLTKYVTRVPGWDVRLTDQLRALWLIAKSLTPCQCGAPTRINRVKKEGPNNGRLFVACSNTEPHAGKVFEWLSSYPHTRKTK